MTEEKPLVTSMEEYHVPGEILRLQSRWNSTCEAKLSPVLEVVLHSRKGWEPVIPARKDPRNSMIFVLGVSLPSAHAVLEVHIDLPLRIGQFHSDRLPYALLTEMR
jgi:hypothetical protein